MVGHSLGGSCYWRLRSHTHAVHLGRVLFCGGRVGPIFTTLHNTKNKITINRLANITTLDSILSLFKPLACQNTWHLTFLGRHWESKELSLDVATETGNGSRRFGCTFIPVSSQRQKLVAGARAFKLNDFSITQLTKNYQVFTEIYNGT